MLRFTCPHCQTVLKVDDARRGADVTCPRCTGRVSVPDARPTGDSDEPEEREERVGPRRPAGRERWDDDEDDRPRSRPRRRPVRRQESSSGAVPWIIGGVVALVLCVAVCCGGGFIMMGRGVQNVQREMERLEADRRARTVTVEAGQFLQEFDANPNAADRRYDGKYVEVTGVVDRVGQDRGDAPYILLRGAAGKPGRRIECRFDISDEDEEARVLRLRPGMQVTVQGEYDGQFENIVQLSECVLLRK